MNEKFVQRIQQEIKEIQEAGLYKQERIITSPQGAEIVENGKTVLNFCANNYLGLSSHPKTIAAAHQYIDSHGYGMSSVRFICGTQDIHKQLEAKLATFLGTEDTILYAAAFDANGGVFEPLFGEQDAIISDALNHASIIDGVRLCKAQRYRYEHNNMADLEAKLKESAHLRSRVIVTDGVFSMDGTIAQLDKICDLADQYDAIVMVDESHASGFMGKTGRGTHEHCGVMGRIDIITGTLGKALGGGLPIGACVARADLMNWKPGAHASTFGGNPVCIAAALKTIELLEGGLLQNSAEVGAYLKTGLEGLQKKHDCIGDVRGLGMMIGVEFVSDRKTNKPAPELRDRIEVACFERGLIILGAGTNTIRWSPPLILTKENADVALEIFDEAIAASV